MQELRETLTIWTFLFVIIIVFASYIEFLFGRNKVRKNRRRNYERMELRNGRRPASRGWEKYR